MPGRHDPKSARMVAPAKVLDFGPIGVPDLATAAKLLELPLDEVQAVAEKVPHWPYADDPDPCSGPAPARPAHRQEPSPEAAGSLTGSCRASRVLATTVGVREAAAQPRSPYSLFNAYACGFAYEVAVP